MSVNTNRGSLRNIPSPWNLANSKYFNKSKNLSGKKLLGSETAVRPVLNYRQGYRNREEKLQRVGRSFSPYKSSTKRQHRLIASILYSEVRRENWEAEASMQSCPTRQKGPVQGRTTLRLIDSAIPSYTVLSMTAIHRLNLATLDISKAYLQSDDLQRDIYMRPHPDGNAPAENCGS